MWHKVVNCPNDWSGNIIFSPKSYFSEIKWSKVIIIFLKEKGGCANYFL